ncbi:putative DNA-binding ribbon-helix-helix protein [Rhodothalassium salexigens DSM 2132]|uniref:Putative DNA-binding ribbon-helix-helix protein n=1 Tax=Rhodothalassium salexigens DSM 2132 TaxID=1188247 RepID=A0A4R2PG36_RHOSA|nr:ribbon-helix-helix domain-containing protein [Rhodothalassium salexigens]MBB4211871.1 putative DNA-binding ribbon-helix-helix protein [Rhodothalassium salexigens DSM 2132]MBK1638912.1 hypothetical protein [Rhodothalassium salexigens DSM 2132]TCP33544.1 putative DNA-binding ribbon-helix-helix protein [Rhodothalassium salexigens DSM 2132]
MDLLDPKTVPERVVKRSVRVAGHRTSVTLEAAFWPVLIGLAEARGQSLDALVTEVDAARRGNLSSALRVFVLRALRDAAPDAHH